MRLLVALTYYHPHWTGLTKVAQRVAEGMAARGHRVTVLTSRYRPDLAAEETLGGVRVIRLPVAGRVSRGMLMPAFPWAARRLVREHDVVQIHTPMLEAPLLAALARRAGARSVVTHHGDLVMPRRPFDQTVERLVTALLRRALRQADRVVVYNRDYLEHSAFLAPFAAKCVAIWPPVAVCEPDLAASRRWRSELGLDGHRLVGFAGRFVEEKGFDFLLAAAPLLARELPDVRLVYAGERNVVYERFFERCRPLLKRAAPYLVDLGLLRDPQRLADFYALCDVFALPSRTDTLALVQVEAMLCGTPVVVSDIPGARMAVKSAEMGRLVRPRDPAALAEGLRDVLVNRARYLRPRAEIERRFDARRALDEYERALTGRDESDARATPRPARG
ncbi:MAG: glycosyltransferase family 4 protein [Deltaproteobacteria bacterium]|nr:glycosyltransferase family 4 protein [Deltaproteobacteria bacterium]